MNRMLVLIALSATGCAQLAQQLGKSKSSDKSGGGGDGEVALPNDADPFRGLPAVSADGQTVALPTYSTLGHAQQRSVTFLSVGDLDGSGATTIEIAAEDVDRGVREVVGKLRAAKFRPVDWVVTPDDPPYPMTITVAGTQLLVAGDPKAQLAVKFTADGAAIGEDTYQLEVANETSPERIRAVGATVVWKDAFGYAYVRYDVDEAGHKDSAWRVVRLSRPAKPAVTSEATR